MSNTLNERLPGATSAKRNLELAQRASLTPVATSILRPLGVTASHRLKALVGARLAPSPRRRLVTATAPPVLIRRRGINTPDEIRLARRLHTPLHPRTTPCAPRPAARRLPYLTLPPSHPIPTLPTPGQVPILLNTLVARLCTNDFLKAQASKKS